MSNGWPSFELFETSSIFLQLTLDHKCKPPQENQSAGLLSQENVQLAS